MRLYIKKGVAKPLCLKNNKGFRGERAGASEILEEDL